MKKLTILCICLVLILLCFRACQDEKEYTPTGEFYVKTSPARGDAGVTNVISLEADYITYESDGDITVLMTVGFGHLPWVRGYEGDVQNTFKVLYKIIEAPWQADKEPAWEKKVEYTDSWYDSKYDSTEQKNGSFLFMPIYGEFYPLYKEDVEFVFPASIERGYLEVEVYTVTKGCEDELQTSLSFFFERVEGVLTLDPQNRAN